MVPDVAEHLARLGGREDFIEPADSRVPGGARPLPRRVVGRIRYRAALARAALRPLRFHDLRRTLAVRRAEVPAVQAWMGHADIQTTMRYVHHRDRGGEARLLAEAFATDVPIIPTLDVEA